MNIYIFFKQELIHFLNLRKLITRIGGYEKN
jgi:hypothetical protein